MNIILTLHPGTPEAVDVTLSADGDDAVAGMVSDDGGIWPEVASASAYLSGLDGKMVTPGVDATVADLAIIIGKHVDGDMLVKAGRLPSGLLADPMTEINHDPEGDQ